MEDMNVLKINCPQAVCRKAHKDGVYTLVKKAGRSMDTFHSVMSSTLCLFYLIGDRDTILTPVKQDLWKVIRELIIASNNCQIQWLYIYIIYMKLIYMIYM